MHYMLLEKSLMAAQAQAKTSIEEPARVEKPTKVARGVQDKLAV